MKKKIKALKIIGVIISVIGFIGLALQIYLFGNQIYIMFNDNELDFLALIFILPFIMIIGAVPVLCGIIDFIFCKRIKYLSGPEGKTPKKFLIMAIILVALPLLIVGLMFLVPKIAAV